jgi:putative oxidoreductase
MYSSTRWTGIALLRIYVGVVFAIHGAQKLFGMGPAATANAFAHMGIPAPAVSAWLVIFAEFFCGLALVFGFLTRLAAIPIVIDMLGAILFVHGRKGFFMQDGGFEYPLMLLIAGLTLVLTGPGAMALDSVLPWGFDRVERGPLLRRVA